MRRLLLVVILLAAVLILLVQSLPKLNTANNSDISHVPLGWKKDYEEFQNLAYSVYYPPDWRIGSGAEGCGPTYGPPLKNTTPPAGDRVIPRSSYPLVVFCVYPSWKIEDIPQDPQYIDEKTVQHILVQGLSATRYYTKNTPGTAYTIVMNANSPDRSSEGVIEVFVYDPAVWPADNQPSYTVEQLVTIANQMVNTIKFGKQ